MPIDALLSLRSALLFSLGLDASALAFEDGAETSTVQTSASAGLADTASEAQFTPDTDRTSPSVCSPEIAQPSCTDPGKELASCKSDAECTDNIYGKCVQAVGMIGAFCRCEYACATDNDCATGESCVCAAQLRGHFQHSACVAADCSSGDQCESGQCDLSLFFNGCKQEAVFACRTGADECASDGDCAGGTCAYDEDAGAWTCQYLSCIFGRPLVIEGAPRVAGAAAGGDWLVQLDPASAPSAERAAELGAYWAEVAALEHASVASFARFTLELLAVGAPPELVADTQRAALDEVEHAQLAWSLASAYLGRPVGPGPLRVDDVAPARSLELMVASLVREGCIGETLAAAEAELMAEAVGTAGLSSALRKVAADEQRHASLAWRTLQWLVSRHGERARAAALEAAAEARRELAASMLRPADESATPAGLLGEAERMTLRRRTFDRVVWPLLSAVLALRVA